ncbi:MAG: ABC transporter ATP-binding protein [Selenomonadaceae bacterium]
MQDILLEVKNLSVLYGEKEILKDISFILPRGKVLAIVGESGSGKSTLLNTITGLLGKVGKAAAGSIRFKNRDLLTLNARQWQSLRGKEIARVYQDASAAFCPIRKIGKQIYEMVQAHEKWSKSEMKERAEKILKRMNLPEEILDEYPFCLSGGMAQRVGILAALLLKPDLLLADEPTSALDTVTQVQVVKEMMKLQNEYGLSILLVTHQLSIARVMADYVVIMRRGSVVEEGPIHSVFECPQNDYTKELLAAVPKE